MEQQSSSAENSLAYSFGVLGVDVAYAQRNDGVDYCEVAAVVLPALSPHAVKCHLAGCRVQPKRSLARAILPSRNLQLAYEEASIDREPSGSAHHEPLGGHPRQVMRADLSSFNGTKVAVMPVLY